MLVALACAVPVRAFAQPPPSDGASATEDPLEPYRERFKRGMERYHEGALAAAIALWEPIRQDLGDEKGYRLDYNLGVAYAEIGDATLAAERLQSFVNEVDARRKRGEQPDSLVAKEEADARARIAGLMATNGRIHVELGGARAAQVDAGEPRDKSFVAWVTPGEHVVTFAPGSTEQETKHIAVEGGQIVYVAPTPPPAPAPPATVTLPIVIPASPVLRRETVHPFSPVILAVSGGLTLAAGVVAAPLYSSAVSKRDNAKSDTPSAADFYNARTVTYAMEGTAIGLAVLTAGLTAWYFLGASTHEVVVTPGGVAGRF